MKPQSFGPIRQVAWVVRDIEESVRNWMRVSGVGPWTCFRNVAMAGKLDGKAVKIRMHAALGYQGDMEIELIEDLGGGPSPYRDPSGAPLVGMHHVGWFSDDVVADVGQGIARGMQVKFEAANAVTRVAYLEDPREAKLLFEFIEMNDAMRAGFTARLEAARTWRGENALRIIDLGG